MGWYDQRFTARPSAIEKACKVCGRSMWFPPSRVKIYATCGGSCSRDDRTAAREARTRPCETCGNPFTPRLSQLRNGGGRFCSQKCNTAARSALLSDEAKAKAKERWRELHAEGRITFYRGEDNPRWKGGKEARRRHYVESGKSAEQLRRYRAKNPHIVREWAQNRRNRRRGRLPYGTIPKIGGLQRWRCAICRCSIKDGYHVDHIVPLSKGGAHEARNIQLLCQPCNSHKWAKDPIDHMQELGRLL